MPHLRHIFHRNSAGATLLLGAALAGMLCANVPVLNHWYIRFLDMVVEIRVGEFVLSKPSLLWINEGLMAVFFLRIGLELKREILKGHLHHRDRLLLPAVAALGGIIVPALVYALINKDSNGAQSGWAIPTSTDIAYSLGILAALAHRLPDSLRLFLMTLAIMDDIVGILIIALFYNSHISVPSLLAVTACVAILTILNRRRVYNLAPYQLTGAALWLAMLESGLHPTLAGVLLAAFIPARSRHGHQLSPLRTMENDIRGAVTFVVLPLFAFVNTGVTLSEMNLAIIGHPVALGVLFGLLLGKPVGVLSGTWIAVRMGWARLPAQADWAHMLGLSMLCGIGFTMSLFLNTLAFVEDTGASPLVAPGRIGVLLGSSLSAFAGYMLLHRLSEKRLIRGKTLGP
jgi:NhaA family Na+:H+ antiporter